MATYYVHQKIGDDSNNGTSVGTAWETVDHALDTYSAGDTIRIKGGYTYTVTPVNLTADLKMQAWADDRPGYEPILTWTGTDHMIDLAPTDTTGGGGQKRFYFYNLTFYRSSDGLGTQIGAIFWNPSNPCTSQLVVYGCNFISDWDPVTSTWLTDAIYGIYVSNSGSTNSADLVDIDYCSFVNIASGVYGYFFNKTNATVDRCLFYMCGDATDNTKAAGWAARRLQGDGAAIPLTTVVLAVGNCLFSGCGHELYNLGTNPTIFPSSNVEGMDAAGTAYPFRDINIFDFRQPSADYIATFDYGSYGESSSKLLTGDEFTLTMVQSFVKPYESRIVSGVEWFSSMPFGKYGAFDIKSDYSDYFFAYWDRGTPEYSIDDTANRDTYVYLSGTPANQTVEAVGVPYGDIYGWYEGKGTRLNDYNSGGNKKKMTSGKQDIVIEQGANWKRSLIWKDKNATPVNLTSYSAKMSIRQRKSDTNALLTVRHDGGSPEISLGGANGTIDIDILASKTGALTFKWGYYDLELTDGSSNVTRILEGRVRLSKQVTLDADTT